MATLLSSLPAPSKQFNGPVAPAAPVIKELAVKDAPPYGKRAGFVPRRPEDFGGGGAFPEIHVAQYPLDMGRSDTGASGVGGTRGGKGTLAVSVNAAGQVVYDAIVRQGSHKGKGVHTDHLALVPKVDRLTGEVWGGAGQAGVHSVL
jgi:SNW domain-containing protein 1